MFIGGFEWVIILLVALLIFGPKNLPKLGRSIGESIKGLKEGMSEGSSGDADEKPSEDERPA